MSFEIRPGGEAKTALFYSTSERLLALGGRLFIPLNGGSQTRRDIRDDWREWARQHNVGFRSWGFGVELSAERSDIFLSACLARLQAARQEVA